MAETDQDKLLQNSQAGLQQIIENLQHASSHTPSTFESIRKLLDLMSSNSTSYATFHELLLEGTNPDLSVSAKHESPLNSSLKILRDELVEGVAFMNISQESEYFLSSPPSTNSLRRRDNIKITDIQLDEIPVSENKSDFETMLANKVAAESQKSNQPASLKPINKKPFLRKGEGTSRFGISKNDLVMQSVNSLPWKSNGKGVRKSLPDRLNSKPGTKNQSKKETRKSENNVLYKKPTLNRSGTYSIITPLKADENKENKQIIPQVINSIDINASKKLSKKTNAASPKTTWATLFTSDQEEFLRQIKQDNYYKNFNSPARSITSDMNESLIKLSQEREKAEQAMFNLLENKVQDESLGVDSSFYNKLFQKNSTDSAMSTPTLTKQFLEKHPSVLHLNPQPPNHNTSDFEGESQWEDCDHESSTDCSCSCEESTLQTSTPQVNSKHLNPKHQSPKSDNCSSNTQVINDSKELQRNMAAMNKRLLETGDVLKQRLHDLEDEIDSFRKENANLSSMREDLETEKLRFLEEKAEFEKKFNEEKILSEYYLAEEKEKLAQKKQAYEKCIREMKGRLSKKDKEETESLKREIAELKEQMRVKDAKSTTGIARLRNQIKFLERENIELKADVEKLTKDKNRILQVNTTTRRLSNIKYLSEINKKLSAIGSRISDNHVDNGDGKYRSAAIEERQRSRQQEVKKRMRAKSVPNLAATSCYAQYFSQKDANKTENNFNYSSDEEVMANVDLEDLVEKIADNSENEDFDIEKIYHETFRDRELDSQEQIKEMPAVRKHEQLVKQPHLSSTLDLTESTTSLIQNKSDISEKSKEFQISKHTSSLPVEVKKPDGSREIRFSNGNKKIISADKKYAKFMYYNGDIQETFFDEGTIKYYYANNNTYQTTYKDGTEVIQFPDGQIEKKYRDGSSEVHFPNGSIRYTDPKNKLVSEEWRFIDGSVLTMSKDGEKMVRFANGQIEVHNKDHKRREYPDGTVKFLYTDGSTETRFASGRVRIKDKHGNLVLDTNSSRG